MSNPVLRGNKFCNSKTIVCWYNTYTSIYPLYCSYLLNLFGIEKFFALTVWFVVNNKEISVIVQCFKVEFQYSNVGQWSTSRATPTQHNLYLKAQLLISKGVWASFSIYFKKKRVHKVHNLDSFTNCRKTGEGYKNFRWKKFDIKILSWKNLLNDLTTSAVFKQSHDLFSSEEFEIMRS